MSLGFRLEGFRIKQGVDSDSRCRRPYEDGVGARFTEIDLRYTKASFLQTARRKTDLTGVLVGCPPCQPYSNYSKGDSDVDRDLLGAFYVFVLRDEPDVVAMENVPRIASKGIDELEQFIEGLHTHGYHIWTGVVKSCDYGVPQLRRRFILLASRKGPIQMIQPTRTPGSYATVRDAIGHLPPLAAGQADPDDPLHRSPQVRGINMERIRASVPGGSWKDWPEHLQLNAHRLLNTFHDVYGRMEWDKPAPTITARLGIGNGRFTHPEQHRVISLREAALLQTFPADYPFERPDWPQPSTAVARMIGNAVPVMLAQAVARSVKIHLDNPVGALY